jgi:phage terminase large subunit GpA-like protein
MVMNKSIVVAALLLLVLFLPACGSPQKIYMCQDGTIAGNQQITEKDVLYICPDGRETSNPQQCSFTLPVAVTQKDAEQKATSFVQGHVQANGWQTTLVNVYRLEDDYQAQLVVSKFNEPSYETIVLIDGTTGVATCTENCDYLS